MTASLSTNPTSMFRWEDSSALEHACWACPTKSNSPKAIHSCYGIHSIPCMAYHSTMHAIGTSHRCSGCFVSREMHDGRHREIAELVAEYHNAEFVLDPAPGRRRALGERSTNMQLRNFVQADEDRGDGANNVDNEDRENQVNAETTSTTTSSDGGGLRLTKSEQRERKKAAKTQKSMKKAARNQARHALQVTSEDVKNVEEILHGATVQTEPHQTHPLATDKTIEDVIARNLGFVKQIESHKRALCESIRAGRKEEEERKRNKKRVSEGGEDVKNEAVIDAILIKLGVDPSHAATVKKGRNSTKNPGGTPNQSQSKKRSDDQSKIVVKLREAVKDDIEKHENDLRQTYIRAGGFFRYAGKAVFDRMTEIARDIDLQTGELWDQKRKREGAAQPNDENDENGENDENNENDQNDENEDNEVNEGNEGDVDDDDA